MGMIGRWIDKKCKREPEVMRHVLDRKFGNLERYVVDGCGCLAGSYGLARGDEWATHSTLGAPSDVLAVGFAVAQLLMWRGNRNYVPGRDGNLSKLRYKRPQAFVVRLLKQRIRKSLGIAPENRPASIRAHSRETAGVGECQ